MCTNIDLWQTCSNPSQSIAVISQTLIEGFVVLCGKHTSFNIISYEASVLYKNLKMENSKWKSCIAAVQMLPSRCSGVSTVCGGGQRLGQGLPPAPPSHHPLWHWDRLGGRGRRCEGESICGWIFVIILPSISIPAFFLCRAKFKMINIMLVYVIKNKKKLTAFFLCNLGWCVL